MKFIHLKEVNSTNSFLLDGEFPCWTVVSADYQTAGKGRSGRVWSSSAGKDLAMSVLLPAVIPTQGLLGLQIALGYAVADVLKTYCSVKLKWPNDLIVGGRKLGGILMETKFTGGTLNSLIFGAGINVNSVSFPENAVSIISSSGKETDLNALKIKVAASVKNYYSEYCKGIKIDTVWDEYSAFYGREVKFHRNGDYFMAVEKGITSDGSLIVEDKYGKREIVSSGEIGYDFSF